MGATIRNEFLKKFDASRTRWQVVVPGRAAILHPRGPLGSLDVVVVYFPTGAEVLEGDAYLLEPLPHLPRSSRSLREAIRRRIADVFLPADVCLTLLEVDVRKLGLLESCLLPCKVGRGYGYAQFPLSDQGACENRSGGI